MKSDPAADEVQRVARGICLSYGEDPDDYASLLDICGPNNEPLLNWQKYEEQARAAILAMDRRAEVVGEPVGYVDRLSEPGRISPTEEPGLEMPVFASPPAPAVAVKLLEWHPHSSDRDVEVAFVYPFTFHIKEGPGGYGYWSTEFSRMMTWHEVPGGIDAARSEAQRLYANLARSALPAPQLSGNPGELPAPAVAVPEGGVTMAALRTANVARNVEWNTGSEPLSLAFRATELAGEVGEACNVLKKLERERIGIKGSRATKDQAAEELADVVICADLIAMDLGIDLGGAVVAKFNATSAKVGLSTMLAAAPEPPATRPEAEIRNDGIEMAADGWMPIETAPTDSHFIAAIKVRHTDGRSWWEQHIIWLDDEDGDVHPDCEQGWNISDYDAWRHLSPPPPATAIRALKDPGDEH